VKKNKLKFKQWKKQFLFTKRKYKNHKTRMRSGILGVDNPSEKGTFIYQEEYIKSKQKKKFK
jgi:hypothetical protein